MWTLFEARQYSDFVNCMIARLASQRTNLDPGQRGTDLYFLAIAAFACHDYQSATYFFDAAATEDFNVPDTENQPAHLFMRLDPSNPKQAAREIVLIIVQELDRARDNYKRRPNPDQLSVDVVRDYFLRPLMMMRDKPERRTLATTFISFLAEWNYRLQMIELSTAGSKEPFFTHLSRGCLLFESLLKENPNEPVTSKTSDLEALLRRLGKYLGIKGAISTSCSDFDALVRSLTDKQPMHSAIECTAQTRNMLSHSVVWPTDLNGRTYDLLVNNIASSCLHAISKLYVPLP